MILPSSRGFRFDPVLLRRGLMFVAIFHLIVQLCYGLPKDLARTDTDRDVLVYYLVMERIHNHEPIYLPMVPGPNFFDTRTPLYMYPPVFSSLLSFLPPMSFVSFARFWTVLLYAAFWIYSACLAKLARGRINIMSTLTAGLVLGLFPGTEQGLSLGQVDPILWAFFGIALTLPKLRGASTMAIALVKLWGIWPLLMALREGKRVWGGSAIVFVFGMGIGILGVGTTTFVESCKYWVTNVLPTLSQGYWDSHNLSVSLALLRAVRITGVWHYTGGVLPVWGRLWMLFAGVAGPILAGIFFRHHKKIVQLSAVGCAAILFGPICGTSYLPILLTLVAALVSEKFNKGD
jgi:hypothetical protein